MRRLALAFASLLAAAPVPAVGQTLSNAVLEDQHGVERNFAREVVGGRIVVIGFTWTGCRTVCPITDQVMARTQELLAGKLGPVRMVTITLDPLNDSPRRMAVRARELGAGPEWLWLSGRLNAVYQVLSGLDATSPDLDAHPPRFLIVDGRDRRFVERTGAATAEELSRAATELLNQRGE